MVRTQLPIVVMALSTVSAVSAAEFDTSPEAVREYVGNYRVSPNHQFGIDPFVMDDGTKVLLISDYTSGVVRRLFPVTESEFVMGPGFNTASPPESMVRLVKDARGAVSGLAIRNADGTQRLAGRVALRREEISFEGAQARLSGTLIVPPAKGPHPAIILLHGSGPLTRYSFGPYPHFFSSLGFAVLIYDKRGTGQSTGVRTDASTGAAMTSARYPDELAEDALAAMHMLQSRSDIDPRRIGFWGSSEGGMLATQVAARSKDVAFAINSSGYMEPLWQTLEYQVGAILRANGAPEPAIAKQAEFVDLWLRVARTGEGWEDFHVAQESIVKEEGYWIFQSRGPFTSLEQLRWDWDNALTFDPRLALTQVHCPVLGVFGERDVATPAARTVENMRSALAEAGNRDVTLRIFPNAGHSLGELPDQKRMAPGVFDTLRSWLLDRVQPRAAAQSADD